MTIDLVTQFKNLLPLACKWAEAQETLILQRGLPLLQELILDSVKVGIANPNKVRTLIVPVIPVPEDPLLKEACNTTTLITNNTAGLTLRYGIYIRSDCANDRSLYVHELVHVAQYERLGSIQAFLQQYLYEVVTVGYQSAPMEQEAIIKTRTICAQ